MKKEIFIIILVSILLVFQICFFVYSFSKNKDSLPDSIKMIFSRKITAE